MLTRLSESLLSKLMHDDRRRECEKYCRDGPSFILCVRRYDIVPSYDDASWRDASAVTWRGVGEEWAPDTK